MSISRYLQILLITHHSNLTFVKSKVAEFATFTFFPFTSYTHTVHPLKTFYSFSGFPNSYAWILMLLLV